MQKSWLTVYASESGHQNVTLLSLHASPPILSHKDTHHIGQESPEDAHAPTLALCPLPP